MPGEDLHLSDLKRFQTHKASGAAAPDTPAKKRWTLRDGEEVAGKEPLLLSPRRGSFPAAPFLLVRHAP